MFGRVILLSMVLTASVVLGAVIAKISDYKQYAPEVSNSLHSTGTIKTASKDNQSDDINVPITGIITDNSISGIIHRVIKKAQDRAREEALRATEQQEQEATRIAREEAIKKEAERVAAENEAANKEASARWSAQQAAAARSAQRVAREQSSQASAASSQASSSSNFDYNQIVYTDDNGVPEAGEIPAISNPSDVPADVTDDTTSDSAD